MEQKSNALTTNQLLTKEDLQEFEQKLLQNLKEFVKKQFRTKEMAQVLGSTSAPKNLCNYLS